MTDFIIGVLTDIVNWLLGQLPTFELPEWAASGASGVATVFGYASSLGAWVPLTLLSTVLAAILVAWGVAFGIKIIRIVASFATFGGGSAA